MDSGEVNVTSFADDDASSRSGAGEVLSNQSSTEEMEFDGNTVLCRVCGDRASGFHYGVHACEGCKGFFRRSIQQKIIYRPCVKNQLCLITRVNRNRCQYCRLKKCIAVGMSRDAVRFGRVPKREKAKILEQMHRVNVQCQGSMLESLLSDEGRLCAQIVDIHTRSCVFTRDKFRAFFERVWSNPVFVQCSPNVACPLNPVPEAETSTCPDGASAATSVNRWNQFADSFTSAIRCVVDFARAIPGFQLLSHEDQVTLLKAGTFEVMLVHLACLFDVKSNTMMFINGKIYQRTPSSPNVAAGFLLNSMFDFAERFNELQLSDTEMALFSALIILSADRPGLRGVDIVNRLQAVISRNLQLTMKANHPDDPSSFAKLLIKIPDLRTLNTIHSEKLLGVSASHVTHGTTAAPPTVSTTKFTACKPDVKLEPEAVDDWKLAAVKREATDVSSSETAAWNFEFGNEPISLECVDLQKCSEESMFGVNVSNHCGGDSGYDPVGKDTTRRSGFAPTSSSAAALGGKRAIARTVKKTSSGDEPTPTGPLVVGHQTKISDPPTKLVLSTPFGSFHRTLGGLWQSGGGAESDQRCPLSGAQHAKNSGSSSSGRFESRSKSFSGWFPHHRRSIARLSHQRNGLLATRKPLHQTARMKALVTSDFDSHHSTSRSVAVSAQRQTATATEECGRSVEADQDKETLRRKRESGSENKLVSDLSPRSVVSVSPPAPCNDRHHSHHSPVSRRSSPDNIEVASPARPCPVQSPTNSRRPSNELVSNKPTPIWNERPESFSSTVASSPVSCGGGGISPVDEPRSPTPSSGESCVGNDSMAKFPNVTQMWGFPASMSRCPVVDTKSRARTPELGLVNGQSLANLHPFGSMPRSRDLNGSFQNCHGQSLTYDTATSAVAAAAAARAAMFYNQMAFQQQLQLLQQRQRELFQAGCSKHRLQSTLEEASTLNWLNTSSVRLAPQALPILPPGAAHADVGFDKETVERSSTFGAVHQQTI